MIIVYFNYKWFDALLQSLMENLTEWITYEWITYGVQKHLIEEDFFGRKCK